ncbi:MBL fold metallo-hydrolase, partial [Streptomyces sp. 24-1644]
PIHWGTFNLAPHAWAEPAEWTKDAAEEAGQAVAFPRPGESFEPGGALPVDPWWRAVSTPLAHPWRHPEPVEATEAAPRGDLDLAGGR